MLAHKNYVSAPNLTVKRELHPHELDFHLKAVGFANAAWKVMNGTIKEWNYYVSRETFSCVNDTFYKPIHLFVVRLFQSV